MDDTVGLVIVKFRSSLVIPAKAGIHLDFGERKLTRHSCASRNDGERVPACRMDSWLRRNDGGHCLDFQVVAVNGILTTRFINEKTPSQAYQLD